MKTRLLYWWDVLRDQLWFIPSLWFAASLGLALVSLKVDQLHPKLIESSALSITTTAASARIVLGSSIGALVTVLGLTLSVTMLAVSQTASQYGARLVRLLFDSNLTQNNVGLFLWTIGYSMVVLRSIRDGGLESDSFTPQLSILIAELACAACVISLLMFINQMTSCMRAETLIRSIHEDVLLAVDSLYPESAVEGEHAQTASQSDASMTSSREPFKEWQAYGEIPSIPLTSSHTGYLQAIDLETLVRVAAEQNHQLRLAVKPGEFIHDGTRLADVRSLSAGEDRNEGGESQQSDNEKQKIRRLYGSHFLMGSMRTPRQDIEAGLFEMVEAGVKALSPGINDPVTAINVIDHLTSLLRELAKRPWPECEIFDAEGKLRITLEPVTYQHLLNSSFGPLRQYAGRSVAVYQRLLEGLEAIAEVAIRSEDRESLARQASLVMSNAKNQIQEDEDIRFLQELRAQLDLPQIGGEIVAG